MAALLFASACLCGLACRYDGRDSAHAGLMALYRQGRILAVCPEVLGGLPVPRTPCEMVGERVVDRAGRDMTLAFRLGAARALDLARARGITAAVLKDKSPSCGSTLVYDGTFSGMLVPGRGVAASLLLAAGITVHAERALPDTADPAALYAGLIR